jgi:hypothetical protein
MTQFALCIVDSEDTVSLSFRAVSQNETLLLTATKDLFGDVGNLVRVPMSRDGASIGSMADDAHNAICDGRAFEETELWHVLSGLVRTCRAAAFWWGDDWKDLPKLDGSTEFMSEIEKQLGDSVGEVYCSWSRATT